jgi:hypothetical protein
VAIRSRASPRGQFLASAKLDARGINSVSRMDRPARRKLTLKPCSVRPRSSRQEAVSFVTILWHGVCHDGCPRHTTVVENILWHDTRLAHDFVAGVACFMLAMKSRAIGREQLCRRTGPCHRGWRLCLVTQRLLEHPRSRCDFLSLSFCHFDNVSHFDDKQKSNRLPVQSGKFLGGRDVLDQ